MAGSKTLKDIERVLQLSQLFLLKSQGDWERKKRRCPCYPVIPPRLPNKKRLKSQPGCGYLGAYKSAKGYSGIHCTGTWYPVDVLPARLPGRYALALALAHALAHAHAHAHDHLHPCSSQAWAKPSPNPEIAGLQEIPSTSSFDVHPPPQSISPQVHLAYLCSLRFLFLTTTNKPYPAPPAPPPLPQIRSLMHIHTHTTHKSINRDANLVTCHCLSCITHTGYLQRSLSNIPQIVEHSSGT